MNMVIRRTLFVLMCLLASSLYMYGQIAVKTNVAMDAVAIPNLGVDDLKDFRYKGQFYGGGISYGYQFVLGRHWNLGATIGIGYAYVRYKKYECEECGDMVEKSHKNYFGPTKAALNLIYIF